MHQAARQLAGLFLALASFAALPVAALEAVVNGNFEGGQAPWVESSTGGYAVITLDDSVPSTAHSGKTYAWLGGYESGTDTLYQDVTIPADALQAKLRFWILVNVDTTTYDVSDTMAVTVNDVNTGETIITLATYTNVDVRGDWVQSLEFDLAPLHGRTVRLKFTAVNDNFNVTSFRIDDVSIATSTVPDPLATRYRLYSPGTFEHLYTTDFNEYTVLPKCCAWMPEGAIYKVLKGPDTYGGVNSVPYFRLYNPSSYQHHWTTDAFEYNFLPSVGWVQEGIDGYILPAQAETTIPLHRMYLNSQGGLHLWTIDANEVNFLVARAGWQYEGIAGYVIPLQ
jgi:hypothetical protein